MGPAGSKSVLSIGGVGAPELAERYGTPLYVYDVALVEELARGFLEAFAAEGTLLAYSVKANGNLTILHRLAALGCGADVTSAGELHRALKAGVEPSRIVFAGVGKSEAEIRAGLATGICAFNVESASELRRIERVARTEGVRARVGVRVNPDVDAATPHEFTRTGRAADKFGVPWREVVGLFEWAAERDALAPRGLAMHIGSQIVETAPYAEALERVAGLAEQLMAAGFPLEYLDIGGGFGIGYDGGERLDFRALAEEVVPRVVGLGLRLILEPGRAIVGEAGVLLTRVEYVKRTAGKTFVIVDGGMSELLRPSHYGGFHAIEIAGDAEAVNGVGTGGKARNESAPDPGGRSREAVDVVGPVCESGDFLARDRRLPRLPAEGELLAVRTAGAYGFTMASNYNGRPRPAEVMVERGAARIVRRRETLDDLIRGEELPT
ncbi:MAG: diaminopimelate decarboxylase [Gemmatimonadetes bacterium]|nr:diaminopimelate decarboxylase [Gemmatimonadota bacterium]